MIFEDDDFSVRVERIGFGRIEIVDGDELEHALWHLRQHGIDCIVQLQQLIGVMETWEEAAAAWDHMSWNNRAHTLQAHHMMFSAGDHVVLDPRIRRGH